MEAGTAPGNTNKSTVLIKIQWDFPTPQTHTRPEPQETGREMEKYRIRFFYENGLHSDRLEFVLRTARQHFLGGIFQTKQKNKVTLDTLNLLLRNPKTGLSLCTAQ